MVFLSLKLNHNNSIGALELPQGAPLSSCRQMSVGVRLAPACARTSRWQPPGMCAVLSKAFVLTTRCGPDLVTLFPHRSCYQNSPLHLVSRPRLSVVHFELHLSIYPRDPLSYLVCTPRPFPSSCFLFEPSLDFCPRSLPSLAPPSACPPITAAITNLFRESCSSGYTSWYLGAIFRHFHQPPHYPAFKSLTTP